MSSVFTLFGSTAVPPVNRRHRRPLRRWLPLLAAITSSILLHHAHALTPGQASNHSPSEFTVASYNVENYLIRPIQSRAEKSEAALNQVTSIVFQLRPDVLALQEIGSPDALADLKSRLHSRGFDLPYSEFTAGHDPAIAVAILSRFPILRASRHTNLSFVLDGRRFKTSRAFCEVELGISPSYRLILVNAHLKSRRTTAEADEAEIREREAICLRLLIDRIQARNSRANVVLCGDFNDDSDSPALRILRGTGSGGLVDTRPSERNGDRAPSADSRFPARRIHWTHYFGRDDVYSRLDYILLNRAAAREWLPDGSYVFSGPDWGLASDHRPILVRFVAIDR
ncbi:MAG: hypothetical protein EXS36_10660 [Pedosphaera sp.]|nr:hypothetical protein [Pedosphaera sp.]